VEKNTMIRTLFARLRVLRSDRRAVTALEYGLIASMVSVVIISAITNEGRNLSTVFNKIATSL
jgi:pilus assembly protein Flp/PilA